MKGTQDPDIHNYFYKIIRNEGKIQVYPTFERSSFFPERYFGFCVEMKYYLHRERIFLL